MTLTLSEVEHIADLARLELTSEEKILYQQQLSAILEFITRLQELDTTGIQPTSSVLPGYNILRQDQAQASLTPEMLLVNAPEVEQNQFKIPAVFD